MENIKNKPLDDELLSRLVQSIKFKIPEHIEKRLDDELNSPEAIRVNNLKKRRPMIWYPLSLSAAAIVIIITVLFMVQFFLEKPSHEPTSTISEIKTQYDLKDKNIKILWVQKKDFELKTNP